MSEKRPRTRGPVCGANTDHGPCGNPAGMGTSHPGWGTCKFHLGNSVAHDVHARHLMAADAADRFGIPIETTAEDALLQALYDAAGDVAFYNARVAELPRDHMVSGTEHVTRRVRQPGGPEQITEETIVAKSRKNVWVELLNEARRLFFAVSAEIVKLKIEDRRVQRAEKLGEQFYVALMLTMRQAGIAADQQAEIIQGLNTAVEAVEAGETFVPGEVLPDDWQRPDDRAAGDFR